MRNREKETRDGWTRLFLATAGVALLALPLIASVRNAPPLPPQELSGQSPATQSLAAPQWQIDAGSKMAFDVASVKQNKTDETNPANRTRASFALSPSDNVPATGGRFFVIRFALNVFIAFAYKQPFGQQNALRSQLPRWAVAERFDIEARAPISNPTKDQFRLMMQSLLADRFKLIVHTEVRPTSVFALELTKPERRGPQLTPHSDDQPCYTGPPAGQVPGLSAAEIQRAFANMCGELGGSPGNAPGLLHEQSRNVNMSQIADYLGVAGNLDRQVIDRSGLNGRYDLSIDFVPEGPRPPGSEPAVDGPSFLDALRDQLGLKLVSMTVPLNVIVVDHVEEPSPN